MRGEEVYGRAQRLGRRELEQLRGELTGRDLAIIGQVADLRLMSTTQIRLVHFPLSEYETESASVRACQRALTRLHRERLLLRLDRRIGGVRMGSASFLYALGPVGQRVLSLNGVRRRAHEPGFRFVDHTLAVGQVVVDLTLAAREGKVEVLTCQSEPRCWREFWTAHGRSSLRPDLMVAVGVGDYEHRWFIEVDRGQESLPTLLNKCRQYQAYYQSGKEQAAHGVFPRVCWSVPTDERVQQIEAAIARSTSLTADLFRVVTSKEMPTALWGAES